MEPNQKVHKATLVDVTLSQPGKHILEIPAPILVAVLAEGAAGGGACADFDLDEGEEVEASAGQDTVVHVWVDQFSYPDLIAAGGQEGTTPNEWGHEGEKSHTIIPNAETAVRLEISVGHGGRGGLVTGHQSGFDGQRGRHGSVHVFAIRPSEMLLSDGTPTDRK